MIYNFIFPQYCRERMVSLLILAVRLFFGVLFFVHGLDKMMNFSVLSETFPSVLGFGSYMTLMVSIFCEFCCSLFLMAGLLIRITVLPMIISMAVAVYLVVFIVLYITGPGRYSADYLIDRKFTADKQEEL